MKNKIEANRLSFFQKIQSRKLLAVIVGVVLFVLFPKDFGGSNMMAVLMIYIGGEVAQKYIERK